MFDEWTVPLIASNKKQKHVPDMSLGLHNLFVSVVKFDGIHVTTKKKLLKIYYKTKIWATEK